ncbi:hypothetical protein LCGC14_1662990 [marine sediment metagenome]|uniref:Uncharacterized protein n=1 Tax=marine sediment metagenome TaxID=412755 RepID=A0A0F9K9C9_9ZZZZ
MPLEHTQLINKDPGGVIDHADASVTPAKLSDPFTFVETPFTPSEAPTQDYHVVNKAYVDGFAAPAAVSVSLTAHLGDIQLAINPTVTTVVT